VVIGERRVGLERAEFSADFCLRLDHPSGTGLTKGEGGGISVIFFYLGIPFGAVAPRPGNSTLFSMQGASRPSSKVSALSIYSVSVKRTKLVSAANCV